MHYYICVCTWPTSPFCYPNTGAHSSPLLPTPRTPMENTSYSASRRFEDRRARIAAAPAWNWTTACALTLPAKPTAWKVIAASKLSPIEHWLLAAMKSSTRRRRLRRWRWMVLMTDDSGVALRITPREPKHFVFLFYTPRNVDSCNTLHLDLVISL